MHPSLWGAMSWWGGPGGGHGFQLGVRMILGGSVSMLQSLSLHALPQPFLPLSVSDPLLLRPFVYTFGNKYRSAFFTYPAAIGRPVSLPRFNKTGPK